MTLRAGLREVAGWPRRRFGFALAAALVLLFVLAALSGLAPFGPATGAEWRYPLLVLLAGLMGLYGGSALATPVGAELTLCDLRWPVLAGAGFVYAARGTDLAAPLSVLLVVATVVLMLWAVVHRLERERAVVEGDGEVCATCRPLYRTRTRQDGRTQEPVIRPLATTPLQAEQPGPVDRSGS